MTITTSPATPPAANWLPAPPGRVSLYLRLYEPGRVAAAGRGPPPPMVRIAPAVHHP
jgi:hypothetical protein